MKKQDEINEINEAIKEYSEAMLENVEASRAITDAQARKTKAHYKMQMASQRLTAMQIDLMQM